MDVWAARQEAMAASSRTAHNDESDIIVCDGTMVTLEDCVDLILKNIKDMVEKNPGGTMAKALDNSLFVMCPGWSGSPPATKR